MRLIIIFLSLCISFVCNAQHQLVGTIGAQELNLPQLNRPTDATFGPDGNLYMINVTNKEILVYAEDGEFVKIITPLFEGKRFDFDFIAINNTGLIYLSSASLHKIIVFNAQGNLLQQIGSMGSGQGQLLHPRGVDIDDHGNVWVADFQNNRIQKFNSTGAHLSEFPSPFPHGIDVSETAIYVNESSAQSFKKYSLNGTLLSETQLPASIISSPEVASDNQIYIATLDGIFLCDASDNSFLQLPSPQNDYEIFSYGLALKNDKLFITDLYNRVFIYHILLDSLEIFLDCKAEGQFNHPGQLAKDKDQNIYVTDQNNHRIQVFDPQGSFIRTFGSFGNNPGQLSFPQDLTVDSNGDCYVLDNTGVSVFNNQGLFLRRFAVNGFGGIAVDNTSVYVAGLMNQGIERFTKNGVSQGIFIEHGSEQGKVNGPKDFILDDSGNLYITEVLTPRIQIFNNNGISLKVIGQPGFTDGKLAFPQGIATNGLGKIYVTDQHEDRIQIFKSTGAFLEKIGKGSGMDPEFFNNPVGIVTNTEGLVYISDYHNHRIQIFQAIKTPPVIMVEVPILAYGDADHQLIVNSNSTGKLSFKIVEGTAAEITPEGLITVLKAGTISFEIVQEATIEHLESSVIVLLEIDKANLEVRVNDQSKIYGENNPELTFSYGAFKFNETFTVLNQQPIISTNASILSPAGQYLINASGGFDDNYEFSIESGILNIDKATLTLTAENKSRVFNSSNPELTMTYEGFKNSDNSTSFETVPTLSTVATQVSPVGSYLIEVSGGNAINYDLMYINGLLTITKASQEILFDPLPTPVKNTLAPFTLQATSTSNLPITYEVTSGPASVSEKLLTLSGEPGVVTIVASQTGNENYFPAENVSRAFEVIPDPILGVNEGFENFISYPNPSKNELFIKLPLSEVAEIKLIDTRGIEILLNGQMVTSEILSTNLSLVSNGLFLLQVKTKSGNRFNQKILVLK